MTWWRPAYVGLGSNLQQPQAQVRAACERIKALPDTRVILFSPLYRSRPLGPIAQPDFVNAVAGILTQLEPRALLDGLRAIEAAMGRPKVHEHWARASSTSIFWLTPARGAMSRS